MCHVETGVCPQTRSGALGRRSKDPGVGILILGVMDQRALVQRAQAGDVDAFEALVRLASGRLFGIAYRMILTFSEPVSPDELGIRPATKP